MENFQPIIKLQAKKPFAEFEGEWNADYHWTEQIGNERKGPNEFVDTRKISTMRKLVKSLHHQEPTESRRLWKEVTECRDKNIISQMFNFEKK